MTKHYCDLCGKEISKVYSFKFLVHTNPEINISSVYVDSDLNRVSGREESRDLCILCYNQVFAAAWGKYKELEKLNDR